jgi:hypothetical protein
VTCRHQRIAEAARSPSALRPRATDAPVARRPGPGGTVASSDTISPPGSSVHDRCTVPISGPPVSSLPAAPQAVAIVPRSSG